MKTAVLLLAGMLILPSVVVGSDFGVLSITSPPDTVRQHSLNVPVALVHAAQGNADTEMVHVHLRIGSSYLAVDSARLAPGDSHVFSFVPVWQAESLGAVSARCSLLVQDADPTNNVLTKAVTVLAQRRDFAAAVIMAPTPIVRIGDGVVPLVLIRANNSNPQPETVAARLRIGTSYTDTVRRRLNPGESAQFPFKLWHASTLGTFPVRCSLLVHDSVPANDTLSRNVAVLARLVDFAAEAMTTVPSVVHVTNLVTPVVTVHAADGNPQPKMVTTRVWIGASFTDTARMLVPPGAHVTYQFKQWHAESLGTFQYRCSLMVHDSFAANDTNRIPITVYPKGADFSVVSVTSPPDSVPLDSQVVPTALVHAAVYNESESVSVRLRIGSAYDDTAKAAIPAGQTQQVTFPTWQAQPLGVTTARCTLLTSDNDSTNDTSSKQVHVVQRGQPGGPPVVLWTRTFPKGCRTEGSWVAQTSDRGYIVAGTWRPDGESFDFYLVKTDSLGFLEWDRPLGVGPVAWASSGGLTRDGGYVIVGRKQDPEHSWALLAKVDSQGHSQWNRTFEADTALGELVGFSVQQTRDGGYIVGGFSGFEGAYLIKTDSDGNTTWQRVFRDGYGLTYMASMLPVRQTSDGGYIIGTERDSVLRLVKTDSLGTRQWERQYPGLGVREGVSVQQTQDSGYIVTGVGTSPSRESDEGDIYLLKTNSAGEFQWKRAFGGPHLDNGRWVTQTSDGGYLVAGITNVTGAEYGSDGYLVKTNSQGNALWTKVIGAPDAYDQANCVQQTADGGYVVTGWMGMRVSDQGYLYLMRLAPTCRK